MFEVLFSEWRILALMHETCTVHHVLLVLCTCVAKHLKKKKKEKKARRSGLEEKGVSTNSLWDPTIYCNWQHSWLQCSPAAEWKIPAMTEHEVCMWEGVRESVCEWHTWKREREREGEGEGGGRSEGAGLWSKQTVRDWLAEKLPLWDHSPHNSFHPHGGLYGKRSTLPASN